MKKNTGAIILREGAADWGKVSSVLREWVYEESEIRIFLPNKKQVGSYMTEVKKSLSVTIA